MTRPSPVILSCEHAGNRVPARYRFLFASCPQILETHRGYDLGIRPLAAALATRLNVPLHVYPWTRLLVDANRCRRSNLFSELSEPLSPAQRAEVLARYYQPYRQRLAEAVAAAMDRDGAVLHLSLHSFTPVWHSRRRTVELGILYDPARPGERALAARLRQDLRTLPLAVRRNAPYQGRADGMTTWLRKQWPPERYRGIELELNQQWLAERSPAEKTAFLARLVDSLGSAGAGTA